VDFAFAVAFSTSPIAGAAPVALFVWFATVTVSRVGVATLAVAVDVTSFLLVALTVIVFPISAVVTVYFADVAPEIAVSPAYHWYVTSLA
jgi:uncharacterized membrane protein